MASLNSGISISQPVVDALADSSRTLVEVRIEGESFVLGKEAETSTNDWSSLVQQAQGLLGNSPNYIILKASHPQIALKWALLQYTPDTSTVREKMMYSSSKTLLLKHLPVDQKDLWQVFATDKKEFTAKGLDDFAASTEAPKPLTAREIEKQAHQYQEASAAVGLSSRATNASNLQFEITPTAVTALKSSLLESGVVALGIENEKTVLIVEQKELSSLTDLSTAIPQETALFVFFKLASKEDIGFCYVSPPSCKIKDRMLFAASRQTVISQVEALLSVSIKKKYEADNIEEVLDEDYENEKSSLTNSQSKLGSASNLLFAKPKRPGK